MEDGPHGTNRMSEPMEIPAFLRRTPTTTGETPMNAHTPPPVPEPVKATKRKRADCYLATVKISIPLDMANADSLAAAIKAVNGIEAAMPDGATATVSGSLGKV